MRDDRPHLIRAVRRIQGHRDGADLQNPEVRGDPGFVVLAENGNAVSGADTPGL